MNEGLEQLIPWVNAIGVPGLLVVGLYAFHKGWVIPGREYQRACDDCARQRAEDGERFDQMKAERDEWKATALRNLNVAERAVHTVAQAADHVTKTNRR